MDWIELPLQGGKQPHPVYWPHIFFAAVYNKRPELWTKRILGHPGAALRYWQSMEHTDFVRRHPFLPRDSWESIIPLGFHGDAGAHSNYDSIYCFNWNSLLSQGPTIQTRFLFTMVPKKLMTYDSNYTRCINESFCMVYERITKWPDTAQRLSRKTYT